VPLVPANSSGLGDILAGSADSGAPTKVGGVYNVTKPTLADVQRGDLQLGTRGSTIVQLADADGVIVGSMVTVAADTAAAPTGAVASAIFPLGFNNGTWDRQRNNNVVTLLASAARTATTSSTDQTNFNGRGVHIVVNVTAEAGVTTLTLTVQGKDPVSVNYYDLITGIVVYNAAVDTPTVTRTVALYPGLITADAIGAGNTNLISQKSIVLPRTWRITITPSDASSQTYSVGGSNIL
jgi:hypothetical protein